MTEPDQTQIESTCYADENFVVIQARYYGVQLGLRWKRDSDDGLKVSTMVAALPTIINNFSKEMWLQSEAKGIDKELSELLGDD